MTGAGGAAPSVWRDGATYVPCWMAHNASFSAAVLDGAQRVVQRRLRGLLGTEPAELLLPSPALLIDAEIEPVAPGAS